MKSTFLAVKNKLEAMAIGASVAIMMAPVHAAPGGGVLDIPSALEKLLGMVYAFVGVGGIISVIMGARNLAGGLNDDGGGQDQQKIAKGKGQIISGLVGIGAPSILYLMGITPSSVIAQFG